MVIAGKLPLPDAVKPVTVGELPTPVHAYVVPTKLEVHGTAEVFAPEQML